jgi:hypothetical protein
VVLTQKWPSDLAGFACGSVTVVGYGQSYTVANEATPGSCRLTLTSSTPGQGQPVLSTAVRYAEAKTNTVVPPAVSASVAAWANFERWVGQQAATPAPPQPAGMGPLEYNRSYSGADYRDARASTAAECAKFCAREPRCQAMTFIPDQSRCWLKSSVPMWQAAPGMISALKRPGARVAPAGLAFTVESKGKHKGFA